MKMDKKRRPHVATAAIIFAAAVSLLLSVSVAILAYNSLPGTPYTSAYGPPEVITRRMQQTPTTTASTVSLGTRSAWATHLADNINQTQELTPVLVHDFEVNNSPLPSVNGLPSTLAFSVAGWVKLQHIASGERCLASHGGPTGRWTLSLSASGNFKLSVHTSAGDVLWFGSVLALNLDEWTHFIVGFDGETREAAFYLNGVLVPHSAPLYFSEAVVSGTLPLQDQLLFIGQCSDNDPSLFTGSLGDIQIYSNRLSIEDVKVLFNPTTPEDLRDKKASTNLLFSTAGIPEIADILKVVQLPAAAILAVAGGTDNGSARCSLFASRMNGFVACSVPSPGLQMLQNVGKPGSITVMTWVRLASLPERKEACLLSHGSWEHGWKLSIIPYMNVQFSVRTASGETLDYFSAPITASLRWQHLAVTYSADDGSIAFYANGFPLDLDAVPKISPDKTHSIVAESAPLTIGRCSPNDDQDEVLHGQLSDLRIFDGVLDFQAIRSAAHGADGELPGSTLVFSMPSVGCIGKPGPLPSLPATMAPPTPRLSTKAQRIALQDVLLQTALVLSTESGISTALRVLDAVDHQAAALLAGGRFGTVKTVVMVDATDKQSLAMIDSANITSEAALESRFSRLEVAIAKRDGVSAVHAAAAALRDIQRAEEKFKLPTRTKWLLILTDNLKPLEHWLHHLLAAAVPQHKRSNDAPVALAVKSLTLTSGGMVKSVGLKHYLTVVGDGDIVPAPFLSRRGYKASYVRKLDPSALAAEAEASTCESLLISADALLRGVEDIPEDLGRLYECSALTAPLASRSALKVAVGSWILELQPAKVSARWDAGTDSMLHRHEMHKDSILRYAELRGETALAHINANLELNLRVKWMFACGGSWAWEAANLVENLERRLPLRAQMQNPFKYCGGHNVLSDAPLSFAERVERMVELPSLAITPSNAATGIVSANSTNQSTLSFSYQTPFPRGTNFLQDDVWIYHRDWFRASNWANWAVTRPRYQIGRYMNEVSGVHARVVQQCNALDEIWVPSAHHIEVFAQAGVERSKLVAIPESIDPLVFDPETVDPMMLPGRKKFVFLANFKFEKRKNWASLIWAYAKAFSATDDVSLFIHTNLRGKFDHESMQEIRDNIWEYIDTYVLDGSTNHRDNSTIPHWELTGKPLSTEAMIGLYKSSDAYVLPTHGEGWGLPYMEAMAMGLPTIATDWGGNLEFMSKNTSLLVRVEGFEASDPYDDWLRSFHWATPDKNHLAELMAWCFYNPDKAKELGRRARADVVKRFSNEAVAEVIMERLKVIRKKLDEEDSMATEVRQAKKPLSTAFQWTIAPDVKLCANMPRAGIIGGSGAQHAQHDSTLDLPQHLPGGGGDQQKKPQGKITVSVANGDDSATHDVLQKLSSSAATSTSADQGDSLDGTGKGATAASVAQHSAIKANAEAVGAHTKDHGAGVHDSHPVGQRPETTKRGSAAAKRHRQQATTSTSAAARIQAQIDNSEAESVTTQAGTGRNGRRRSLLQSFGGSGPVHCPGSPTCLAFITPFVPRRDGLSHHAAALRNATLSACPTLTIDVFAVVLDFFSSYSEPYNASDVKHVIFRESWVDYASAAQLINSRYDGAILNFKLGAFGGTASSYAVCMVKSLTKPAITILHSIHANIDDALQFNLLQILAESDAAVVMSHRAKLQLDTAVGFLPSAASILRPKAIHVVPNGAHATPEPIKHHKSWAKEKLGMAGKRVMVTAGLMGPDKGVQHVMHALEKLPQHLKDDIIYIVAGQPADCGANCIEYYPYLEDLSLELNLTSTVALMPEALTPQGWSDLWTAADVAVTLYPEDLIPHPSTFMEAMAAGAVPVTTPFAAALTTANERSAVLVWERDPIHVAAGLRAVLELSNEELGKMQHAAWKAAQGTVWKKVGREFASKVVTPAVEAGRAAHLQ